MQMKRRIVIYENNQVTGIGENIFSFEQTVTEHNNILEKDIAAFILQLEKPQIRKHQLKPLNAMLVVKYILFNKKRYNSFIELIDYIFHKDDFKPVSCGLPDHVSLSQEHKDEIRKDLEVMRV